MSEITETRLTLDGGRVISCRYVDGNAPCIVFLHGTLSDKNASKSLFLQTFCMETHQAFCSFDFTGHGDSSGKYTEATVGIWLQDALGVLDKAVEKEAVLVGSSMGGWIMLLAAMLRPQKVVGCLGIAAAPDFTTDVWNAFSPEQKKAVLTQGIVYTPNGWTPEGDPWTFSLFEDAKNYLMLDKKVEIHCPVVLLHGDKDNCVPVTTAFKIKDAVTTDDVKILVVKNGTHRFSSAQELEIVRDTTVLLLKHIAEKNAV